LNIQEIGSGDAYVRHAMVHLPDLCDASCDGKRREGCCHVWTAPVLQGLI